MEQEKIVRITTPSKVKPLWCTSLIDTVVEQAQNRAVEKMGRSGKKYQLLALYKLEVWVWH